MAEDVMMWPELATELYNKLTRQNAKITYEFQDVEIYVPAHHWQDAPLARWKVNGILKIRTREVSGN